MTGQNKQLAANLRLMCNRYTSIADICRQIKINRQQFNKYLSGQSSPSLHNLHRIAEFFGVDEAELSLPHDQFTRYVFARPNTGHVPAPIQQFFGQNRELMAQSQQELHRYCGYYFMYHRSPDWPDALIKSLFVIFQAHEMTFGKTIEHQFKNGKPGSNRRIHKVESLIFHDTSRIYALERDSHEGGSNSFMLVYPSDHRVLTLLPGLLMSVSMAGDRKPFASRILFEYLGRSTALKPALKACGVYPESDRGISADIWSRTSNAVPNASGTLSPAI